MTDLNDVLKELRVMLEATEAELEHCQEFYRGAPDQTNPMKLHYLDGRRETLEEILALTFEDRVREEAL